MTLGRELQLRAMRSAQRAREIGVLGGEEPDRPAALFVFFEQLRGHGLAVAFLDARESQHGGAIALERLPEFGFDFRCGFMTCSGDEYVSIAASVRREMGTFLISL